MGEISFCAYNTGVGRYIVEQMHQTATVAEWYKKHGKHAVYANPRRHVPLEPKSQPVTLTIPRDGMLVPVKSPEHRVALRETAQSGRGSRILTANGAGAFQMDDR